MRKDSVGVFYILRAACSSSLSEYLSHNALDVITPYIILHKSDALSHRLPHKTLF